MTGEQTAHILISTLKGQHTPTHLGATTMTLLEQAIAATTAQQAIPAPIVQREAPQAAPVAANEPELFTVDKRRAMTVLGPLEGRNVLMVGERCINPNMVSDNYEVHQPKDIYRAFANVATKTGLTIGGVLQSPTIGGLIITAKYGSTKILGEDHDIHFTLFTSHDGKNRTILTLDSLRMACFNQIPILQSNQKRHIISEKHFRNALDINVLEAAIENTPNNVEAYAEKADVLINSRLPFNIFLDMYAEENNINTENPAFDKKAARIKEIYYSGKGQNIIPDNTGYKALQAITYMNTHELRETSNSNVNRHIKKADNSCQMIETLYNYAIA